jgi:hypothetical protein
MSETVHYRGTLTKVERLGNETLEEQCKRIIGEGNFKNYYESYQEMLLYGYEYSQDYFLQDDILYSVSKKEIDTDEDIFKSNENEDGTIEFEVKYYNGGCGFNEALEYALDNKNPFQY